MSIFDTVLGFHLYSFFENFVRIDIRDFITLIFSLSFPIAGLCFITKRCIRWFKNLTR